MASSGIIQSTAEASVGGYQGVLRVRGVVDNIALKDPNFAKEEGQDWEPKRQVEVTLRDAAILSMFPNCEEFELKDGKFTLWIGYAPEGKVPTASSVFSKCFLKSAEDMKRKPDDFIGEYVTLERRNVMLVKLRPDKDKGETEPREVWTFDSPSSRSQAWCFVSDETASSKDVMDYVRSRLIGLKPNAAKREVMVDPRIKQFPEYKDAVNSGEICDMLGLELVDEKYVARS